MRALVLAGLVVASGCGRNQAEGDPPAAKSPSEAEREQARFDADRRPDLIIKALDVGPGAHVADIGASSGLLTVHLARAVAPNGKVVATDIDSGVLDLLEQRLAAMKLSKLVERKVVAADTPGLDANSFDVILLAEVDHLITDEVAWLKAAIPALKPGGRIAISNKIHRRNQSLAAAVKAGLVLKSESTPVPTHFIAVFTAPGGKDK